MRYDEDMTISQAVKDRADARYDVGARVIAKLTDSATGQPMDVEELVTVTFVQYNPRRCSMCQTFCGQYNLSGHGVRAYRACELRPALTVDGAPLGLRVGRALVELDCLRLDEAYAITVWVGDWLRRDLGSSHKSEIVARQAARSLVRRLADELV